MKKLLIALCVFLCVNCYARVSFEEGYKIYNKLIKINKLSHPKKLYIMEKRFFIFDENGDKEWVEPTDINGVTTPQAIMLTKAAFTELEPAELAHLMAHELAHWRFKDSYYDLGGKFQEDRADKYAAIYAEKIGYNRCDQAKLYLKFYELYGNGGGPDDPHSSALVRYHRLWDNNNCKGK